MNSAHTLLVEARTGRTTDDYRNGQVIFVQGERAAAVCFVQQGRVKMTVTSEQGKEAVIGIMQQGQFFGEGCLQGQRRRTATATAFGGCRVTSIKNAAMLSGLRDERGFSKFFVDHLLRRNIRIQEDLADQLLNSSERRLARLLLLLANHGEEGSPPVVPVTLSQETLAEMIGTTRSRVSFFMNKFRNLGLIDYKGQIHVHRALMDSVARGRPANKAGPSSRPA